MSDYKQCPNGHYYQGNQCPFCKSSSPSTKTEVYNNDELESPVFFSPGGNYGTDQPTEPIDDPINNGTTKTTVSDGNTNVGSSYSRHNGNATIIYDEDDIETEHTHNGGERPHRINRETRKFVGWLVSYTLDSMGVDFKLYEGRNIIGRDMDCNITVNDEKVSSKHAVILFRAGKYSITDNQSSNGTFVNDVDIELSPCYLQDGDIIKIGQTTFKFRTSF